MDPFLDIIRLLRPSASLMGGGLDAVGDWSLGFRKRDDLLFCWLERGACQLLRQDHPPVDMQPGDFVLVRTASAFRLASDAAIDPVDSEAAVTAAKGKRLRLGTGSDRAVTLHAGKFAFDSANEDLLTGLLPPFVHIAAAETSLDRLHLLLKMSEAEARQPGPASAFIIVRLIELILVEILRTRMPSAADGHQGLLCGLAEPKIAKALSAMHREVAQDWTVATLAKLCGVSRSAFATRFRKVVGVGPIQYLLDWRMALAKDELRGGRRSISEIGFSVGFQSASAFSTAFSRSVGCSPRQFADRAR